MVYDPIRDREVPSPAVTRPPQADAWPVQSPVGPGATRSYVGASVAVGQHPHLGPESTVEQSRLPPPYHPSSRAPSYSSPTSAPSSSLRGLLNDPAPPGPTQIRRTPSSSSIPEEDDQAQRHHINRLLNNNVHPPHPSAYSAPPLSKSNSASSQPRSSPSNPSPGSRHHLLDPNGFLTPATPASAYPRSNSATSRSPHPQFSPQKVVQALPQTHQEMYGAYNGQYGESSHRRESGGPHQMLPPQQPLHPHEVYEYERRTPGPSTLPLRSPSISLSPRSQHQALPYTSSRPGSAASGSHPFAYSDPAHSTMSPPTSTRRLSEDQYRPPSSGSNRGSIMATPAQPARRSSQASATAYPAHRLTPIRSPSPIAPRVPYNPNRLFAPDSLLQTISSDEAAHLRFIGMSNNPLRRRKARRPLPSWSGPSPGAGVGPGPGGRQQSIPAESDSSYFPNQGDEARRSTNHFDRHESVGSSFGRPSVTPTPGAAYAASTHGYPPAFEEHPISTPMSLPREGAKRGRKPANAAGNGEDGTSLKRTYRDRDEPGHDSTRRKVSETHYVGNVAAVASHYNARPEVGVEGRELSPIIGLKKFNNWVKSVLIGKFAFRQGAKVLDIGCGKGGDLNKWKQARIRLYVGIDLAATSVDQARERYERLPRPGFDGHFFAHDCFSKPIHDILPEQLAVQDLYDNVTMQFCMHYAFESASKARMMIENVSRFLRKGGVFMGTIPNADLLLERLNSLPEDDTDLRFGNTCYYVQFAERRHKGIYGHQYRFFLTDAVEDVPEYIVNWDNFEALALEYGLRLQYKRSFHDILTEEKETRDFGPLLGKMGVVNERGESAMDADQWEAANLYMAFAFEKVR